MSENKKKLKEMNKNTPLFFILNTVTNLEEKVDTLIHVDFSALNNAARLTKIENNLKQLIKIVEIIAKGLPLK